MTVLGINLINQVCLQIVEVFVVGLYFFGDRVATVIFQVAVQLRYDWPILPCLNRSV